MRCNIFSSLDMLSNQTRTCVTCLVVLRTIMNTCGRLLHRSKEPNINNLCQDKTHCSRYGCDTHPIWEVMHNDMPPACCEGCPWRSEDIDSSHCMITLTYPLEIDIIENRHMWRSGDLNEKALWGELIFSEKI